LLFNPRALLRVRTVLMEALNRDVISIIIGVSYNKYFDLNTGMYILSNLFVTYRLIMIFEQRSVSTQQPFYFSDVLVSLLWNLVRHLPVVCQVRCNVFFSLAPFPWTTSYSSLRRHHYFTSSSAQCSKVCIHRLNLCWARWYYFKDCTVHCDSFAKSVTNIFGGELNLHFRLEVTHKLMR
jgi:hypothetical protein